MSLAVRARSDHVLGRFQHADRCSAHVQRELARGGESSASGINLTPITDRQEVIEKELDNVRANLSAHGLALDEIKSCLKVLIQKGEDAEPEPEPESDKRKAKKPRRSVASAA